MKILKTSTVFIYSRHVNTSMKKICQPMNANTLKPLWLEGETYLLNIDHNKTYL
jgi:diphthamide synthase (EF-2-diphthine--ammonia ligase)